MFSYVLASTLQFGITTFIDIFKKMSTVMWMYFPSVLRTHKHNRFKCAVFRRSSESSVYDSWVYVTLRLQPLTHRTVVLPGPRFVPHVLAAVWTVSSVRCLSRLLLLLLPACFLDNSACFRSLGTKNHAHNSTWWTPTTTIIQRV